jgi:hypothetical protein
MECHSKHHVCRLGADRTPKTAVSGIETAVSVKKSICWHPQNHGFRDAKRTPETVVLAVFGFNDFF